MGRELRGRYLSPEPIQRSPYAAVAYAYAGYNLPVYSYAGNNPVAFVDPDGRWFRNVSPRLQRYLNAMKQTEIGSDLYKRIAQSPRAFDFLTGPAGKRPNGRPRPGSTSQNQCGGPITVRIDDQLPWQTEWGILQTVGHEATHAVDSDILGYLSNGEGVGGDAVENHADYIGADIAFDFFPIGSYPW